MALNFKHLRYFWAVAKNGNLTRAAADMNVSQSALSVQIKHLEQWLGQSLFIRQGRSLVLTEAGKVALEYADSLFSVSDEMVSVIKGKAPGTRQVIRVGALATLSRNFQITFLHPLLSKDDVSIVLRTGDQTQLLRDLETRALDVVLTNQLPSRDQERAWATHTIDEQSVSVIGNPCRGNPTSDLAQVLTTHPVILPTMEHAIRMSFDAWCERKGLRPQIRAEVDDMTLLRLMVREDFGVAVVPRIVVRDELNDGTLMEFAELPGLTETFHAVTLPRKFESSVLQSLLRRIDDGIAQTNRMN
ncbi:MAG: LysR family transcriptional regulator [Woeseiaceae bacterium]